MSLLNVKKYMDPEVDQDPEGQKPPDRRIRIWGGPKTSRSADPDWQIRIGRSGLVDPAPEDGNLGYGLYCIDYASFLQAIFCQCSL
jgi:hypothetical protein